MDAVNGKALVGGIFGAFVCLFGIGFVWHIAVFPSVYSDIAYSSRPEILVPFMAAGTLALAVMMTFLYPHGKGSRGGLAEGARFGLWIGLLLGGVWIPWVYGLHSITSFGTLLVMEGSYVLLGTVLAGIAIGVIHEKLS